MTKSEKKLRKDLDYVIRYLCVYSNLMLERNGQSDITPEEKIIAHTMGGDALNLAGILLEVRKGALPDNLPEPTKESVGVAMNQPNVF